MILRSFYARISILFLVLILLLGSASLITAFNASRHLFDEVEQILNREYASSIALELDPMVKEGFSKENIQDAIHYMMVLNPMVEIYLLDGEGRILSYFTHPDEKIIRHQIEVAPLQRFIDSGGWEVVQGADPRTENAKKPFSAAKLQMGEDTGYVYVILRGESYDRSLETVGNNYYIRSGLNTFLTALGLTILTGLILFSLLTRRLKQLSNGVRAFQTGKLDYRITITGKDELSDLGRTFNEMAETIQKGMDELKHARKERTDLIANISHDLRSPLTSIRGHLETILLKDKILTDEEKRNFLEITIKNVSGFQKLVEELFDLARLESRAIRLQKEDFPLAELVQDVVLKVKPQADFKNVNIKFIPGESLSPVSADIALIERVLTNILENALAHTPEEGHISINLNTDGNYQELKIADTGPGIPPEDLPFIFERFYRADKSRSRMESGTGLGLAIAKEIVGLHGGGLKAENRKEGGALFRITLPERV